jgi:peptide/nickel transport system permease protein
MQALPVLLLSSVLVFLFIRLVPGDPAVTLGGTRASAQQIDALRHRFALDQPLATQYVVWLSNLVRGDFGTSYLSQRPVSALIQQRLPVTAHLAVGAMLVTLLVGAPLGLFVATHPRHIVSRAVALASGMALATPTFWLGILLLLLFAVGLHWLPASGFVNVIDNPGQSIRLLVLPSVTLGLYSTAILVRFLRATIAEVDTADFVRTAHAKGLPTRLVLRRHVLRIALLPVITVMAVQFGYLLSGAVITESIFGLPGLGRLMVDSILGRDYLVVQASMLLFVGTFIVVNTGADICQAALDPRTRRHGA